MARTTTNPPAHGTAAGGAVLRFTPAEWRFMLRDRGFLSQPDNAFSPPRRLMGLAVQIVPDHSYG